MDKMEILNSELSFRGLTFQYLASCMRAYESKEMLSTVVMGAVFAESILKDICKHFGFEPPKDELQNLIDTVKNKIRYMKGLEDNYRFRLLALVERCDEIRLKRNSNVHDNGIERKQINIDAADVHNNAMAVAELYLKTAMADEICKQRKESGTTSNPKKTDGSFRVFISTITPHMVEQRVFLNAICNQLSMMGITPVCCKFNDYDRCDPMGKVRKTIKSCDAVLVIGLERSHSFYYRDKESSGSEKEGIHRKHTSGWLHVESGIAMALGKPLFVLCQKDIYGDGVFDRDWNSYIVVEFTTPLDAMHNKVQLTLRKIQELAELGNEKAPEKEGCSSSEA